MYLRSKQFRKVISPPAIQGFKHLAALEQKGIFLPIVSKEIRDFTPLIFGDRISLETILKTHIKYKLELKYRILNAHLKLVAGAS